MSAIGTGGVGTVLPIFGWDNFYLKLFPRKDRNFWMQVRSIQEWTGRMRFLPGCNKIPVAMRFWIHQDDAEKNSRKYLNQEFNLDKILEPLSIDPSKFILCSEEQLKKIYYDDLLGINRNVRLLATYPVQKQEDSVKNIIDRGDSFSEEEILRAFYQILGSIEYIYRSGCAHSDIKPDNILVSSDANGTRNFFLNDYDSFSTNEAPSKSATRGFIPEDCQSELKKKFPSSYRTLYDCYALAVTLLCMIGKTNDPESLAIPLSFTKLPEQAKKLYRITTFDPKEIADIIKELEKNGCKRQRVDYFGENCSVEFDKEKYHSTGIFGYFHEQIRLTDFRDPLWQVEGCCNAIPEELSDIFLRPLVNDNKFCYLHAPDDVKTGKRPSNFENYTPKTLSNTSLSRNEKEILLSYGQKLNEYVGGHAYVPQKDHIVWWDGEMKILWGVGETSDTPVNYKEYFRYLVDKIDLSYDCWRAVLPHEYGVRSNGKPKYWQRIFDEVTEEYSQFHCLAKSMRKDYSWLYQISEFKKFVISKSDDLSLDNWLCFLPEIPELENKLTDSACRMLLPKAVSEKGYIIKFPAFQNFVIKHTKELTAKEWLCLLQKIPGLENKLTVKVCQQLLMEFSGKKDYAWLFSYEVFRKKIEKESFNFNVTHWLEIRKHTDEFDDRIDEYSILELYKRAGKKQKNELLQNPQWKSVIQKKIATDPRMKFRNFFKGQQYDKTTFLQFFPEHTHSDFTGRQWGKFIAVNPELINLLPEKIFPFLNRKAWIRILGFRPDLAKRYTKWDSFSPAEWVSILVKQRELKKYLPNFINFSEKQKDRLEKNQVF